MDQEELAKEIARRKQVAKDLNLRELVSRFYSSHLQYHSENIKKGPDAILPALKDTLTIKGTRYSFNVNGTQYEIVYSEGKKETRGRGDDETVTTPIQLSLERGCRLVFEFKMTKSVTYAREAPYFSEYFGDVTAFIEGPWITQLTDFSQEADQYRRDYWAARNAEKSQKKALAERKRFGL
jgi:hypothetical protein